MKKCMFLLILLVFVMLVGCNEQEAERQKKDQNSAQYGLNRTLTVYDQNGKVIKEYKGKFDLDGTAKGGKVKFDLPTGDGSATKRVIIYNAVVICEEQ